MAASNDTKGGKVFTFKKRSKPVQEVILDGDCDDDDFKPCKHPFPGGKKGEVKQFPPPVAATGKAQRKGTTVKAQKKRVAGSISGIGGENDEEEGKNGVLKVSEELERVDVGGGKEDVVVLDEQENCDVMFVDQVSNTLASSSSSSGDMGTGGKGAWKDLMSQMQKNQESLQKAPKKGKASAKRGLVQSPKPKVLKGNVEFVPSPVKKNARLGSSGEIAVPSTALKEFKNGTTVVSQTSSSSTQIDEFSVKDSVKKVPATIAPIFLPPAERKAIQKSSCGKNHPADVLEYLFDSDSTESQDDGPEDPTQFNGNVVILNQNMPDKDPYGGNKTKVCPFYKKLPGVPFCVDAFNYGLIPGMEVYFLSHFHSDHYIGLNKKFCKTIICSYPTGNLVKMKLYVEEQCIRKLRMNKPYIICDSEVTQVDANHCPGSVMFIFRFKNGTVTLHVGDFRYTPNMLTSPHISGLRIDHLYLDTTYCSPQYDFPTQNESVSNVISQVKRHLEYRPQTLIVCGSYLIGKERVYFTLAEAIGSKVFGTYDKRKIINALENKKFSSLLSADENTAQVHVVPMFSISAKNLQEYLAKYPQYTNIIGIKPSGWQFSSCGSGCSVKSHYNDTVTVLGVPYSEHSSFSELKEFVTNLKPKRVQPTVNVGNAKKREEMMRHIESWLSPV